MAVVKPLVLSTAVIISLTACEASPWREYNTGDPVKPTTKKEQLLATARNAAMEQRYEEVRSGALADAEARYRESPSDPYAALNYAKILRKVNMTEQAEMILSPLVENPAQASEEVLVEYSKLKLSTGDFDTAQMIAQEASFIDNSPESLMLLGVALDAQGHHEAAEGNLRDALENVGMDIELKNKILNNLAVSLMAQGRRNEASLVLSQIEGASANNNNIIEANLELSEKL